ncbi:hypothetical protein GCM10007301_23970 [Azorhizobium oxalatiphilum]|uniref:Zinc ribbon domain-containing protein n=1 Tax=Azorhizobium oxalatiphilum TaxID=980631 RepID=A0A917FBX8_9HYPH|nr:hypothetical protein [Azorhizobium oxalatiphilum]GGF63361.1 hypothetical protein GCM10007301_23970 [Azorhizobium oxalatiphilum]
MSPQPETCPGCGARVHPRDVQCPACGMDLPPPSAPRRSALPVLVGVLGVLVALAAGAGVWLLLSPARKPAETNLPAQQQAAAPVVPEPPAPDPAPTPVPPAPQSQASAPVPAAPMAPTTGPLQALPPGAGRPALPDIPSDPQTRAAFAKTTQDNFKENGLDIAVTAGGPENTVVTLKFSFPAKTAVDLIAGGPFARQCKARGIKTVVFQDPNGASWTLDVDTDQLSQNDAPRRP